jgi:hypothetical protein
MADAFANYTPGLESPATHLTEIVPNDTQDLAQTTRALNVGTTGVVRVTTMGGETASIYIAAGIAFPLRVTRIWATGTTATNIVSMT